MLSKYKLIYLIKSFTKKTNSKKNKTKISFIKKAS